MEPLPTLYKRTSKGKVQQWTLAVLPDATIRTEHGQVGGKIQTIWEIIHEGKNLGKANETTAMQQAELEATARHTKQLKKGYVASIEAAEAGEVDGVIEGGVAPMLAHTFSKHGHKIQYPAYAQPKYDGHRCIAVVENGRCTIWTRTRKPILGVPHIERAIEQASKAANWPNFVADGELYCHDAANFEKITSFIRQETPQPGHEIVEYYIYDLVNDQPFETRTLWIKRLFPAKHLVQVKTIKVNDEDELMETFEEFLAQGYEGAMVRNASGHYINRRSYDLQKIKEFDSAEWVVTGVERGRGKMADKAIFVCKTGSGVEFRVKMKGSLDALRQYVDNPGLAVGRELEVQYQGLTAYGAPRFPVGLRIKETL